MLYIIHGLTPGRRAPLIVARTVSPLVPKKQIASSGRRTVRGAGNVEIARRRLSRRTRACSRDIRALRIHVPLPPVFVTSNDVLSADGVPYRF